MSIQRQIQRKHHGRYKVSPAKITAASQSYKSNNANNSNKANKASESGRGDAKSTGASMANLKHQSIVDTKFMVKNKIAGSSSNTSKQEMIYLSADLRRTLWGVLLVAVVLFFLFKVSA